MKQQVPTRGSTPVRCEGRNRALRGTCVRVEGDVVHLSGGATLDNTLGFPDNTCWAVWASQVAESVSGGV